MGHDPQKAEAPVVGHDVSGKKKSQSLGVPGGPVVKSLPCSAGEVGSIPGSGN